MASTAQGHPAFPGRSTYVPSGKLPDRMGLNNPPPFGSSALPRRPDQQAPQYAQGPLGPQQQIQGGGGGRGHQHQQHQQSGAEKEPNPLNELSEEQREEINEAVRLEIKLHIRNAMLFSQPPTPTISSLQTLNSILTPTLSHSSPSSTSTVTATSTTTNCASPSAP